MHESMVLSKYLSLFGTTLAGLLNFDDRVALSVAKSLPEGDGQIAVMGLSGGGCRTLYLHATNSDITASVSVGAMATYQSLLDIHVAPHSWMFFPQNLAQFGDWPDVALLGGPKNLYIQYCGDDQLFTKEGMKDADTYINKRYESGKYKSSFYPVKHSFTKDMQEDAFNWLDQVMEK
jgi:dienelactone hydrolase